jgi:hypothetical protein
MGDEVCEKGMGDEVCEKGMGDEVCEKGMGDEIWARMCSHFSFCSTDDECPAKAFTARKIVGTLVMSYSSGLGLLQPRAR